MEIPRLLLDHTVFAILLAVDQTIVFANPAAHHLTGYPPESLPDLPLLDLFHPDDRDRLREMCRRLRESDGIEHPAELRLQSPDGRITWAECLPSLMERAGKQITILSLADAGRRRELQRSREELQALLLAALEQSPAGILIVDSPEMIVRHANHAAIHLRNYDGINPIGLPLPEFSSRCRFLRRDGEPYSAQDEPLFRAMTTGSAIHNEEMIVEQLDGSRRWVLAQARAVKNDEGRVIAGILITSDITAQKEAETAIRDVVRDLQQVQDELARQNRELQLAEGRIHASLRQYTDLYEHAPVGYLSLSTKGVVMRANLTACNILDIPRDSLLRRSLLQQVVSRHMCTLADHLQSVLDSRKRLSCEVELKTNGGERRFVRFESVPTNLDDEEPLIRAALIDISQRMHAEIKLGQSEQRYRTIVESPLTLLCVIDNNYTLTFASQGFCHLLKYPYREMIGKDFRTLLTEAQHHLVEERYLRRQRGEEVPQQYQIDAVCRDGSIRSLIASMSLSTAPDNTPQTVVSAVDITGRMPSPGE